MFRSDRTRNIGHAAVFNVYFSANAPKLLGFSPRKIEINQNLISQIFYPFIYLPINITNVKRVSIKTCKLSFSKNARKHIGNIAIFLVLFVRKTTHNCRFPVKFVSCSPTLVRMCLAYETFSDV